MQITWNGTGSAWSTYYGNSSAVLENAGSRLIIDCGHTVPGRLRQMGIGINEIDAIFISHLHGDHVYGLEELGFRSYLQEGTKIPLLVPEGLAKPLWDNVLSGTMKQKEGHCTLEDYYEVHTLRVGTPFVFGCWTLEVHPVDHVPNLDCFGVKVCANGSRVGFTADTKAGVAPFFYEDTQMVFHDCSFLPCFEGTVHTHFEQLLEYSPEYRKKTWLVHYDDETHQRLASPEWRHIVEASGMHIAESFVPVIS